MLRDELDYKVKTGPHNNLYECPVCQGKVDMTKAAVLYNGAHSVGISVHCVNGHYLQYYLSQPHLEYAANPDGDQLTI